ncbi:MAG: alkaline phosphatase family protein [Cyanobacteria bacterium P01_D01_bin.1]
MSSKSTASQPDNWSQPLVILGLDAGDPDLIQQWVQAGDLPNLAALMNRGCYGRLTGPELVFEDGVWVNLFSGQSAGHHGYHYYRQLQKPSSYGLRPVWGPDFNSPAFWSYLQGSDQKVALIDVPEVLPIEGLQGIQLADWAVHRPLVPPSTQPPDLLAQVKRIFGRQINIHEDFDADLTTDQKIYQRLLTRVQKKGELCRRLWAQDDYDLMVGVFAESHTGGHQLWSYAKSESGLDSPLKDGLRSLYQAIDREIGLILQQLPDSANVFVVSPLGLQDQYPTGGLMADFLLKLGYRTLPTPGDQPISLSPMAILRRILPESVRIALSQFLPRETRERLLSDQFQGGTDWSKTTVFMVPSEFSSYLHVNLKGREPLGIVEPGDEYEALLERLEQDLRQLVDPRSGEPVVQEVLRPRDLFDDVHDTLPDVVVKWRSGVDFMETVEHPSATLQQERPEFFRGSDHNQSGFVAAAGPAISARGELAPVALRDMAPTFLQLMGQPIPPTLSGRCVEAMSLSSAHKV